MKISNQINDVNVLLGLKSSLAAAIFAQQETKRNLCLKSLTCDSRDRKRFLRELQITVVEIAVNKALIEVLDELLAQEAEKKKVENAPRKPLSFMDVHAATPKPTPPVEQPQQPKPKPKAEAPQRGWTWIPGTPPRPTCISVGGVPCETSEVRPMLPTAQNR